MIHSLSWLLVEAGTSLFEVILIFTFLNGFHTAKEVVRLKKITVFILAFIMQFVVGVFFYDVPNALLINSVTIFTMIALMLYQGKVSMRLFSCFLLLAILAVIELISMCILVVSLNIEAVRIQTEPLLKFMCVTIKNILSFVIIKVICSFRRSTIQEIGRGYFALLLVVPVICVLVALLILDIVLAYGIQNLTWVLFAYLGLMYVNAIVFGIFEGLLRQMDKEYKYKMIEKQLEMQLTHYNKLAENRSILSEALHDFKNHLNCIYNLYKYNNSQELGRYIENLVNVSDTQKVIDTGNPVIDALLNDKFTLADKIGIDVRRELNLPSNLHVAPTDICAILGNSLDNAIEACRRINNAALRREIALSMTYRDSYLVIVVANTIDKLPQREGKFFRSSKPSPEIHGLGMHSIERTVKKYDGNMVVKCEQGQFKLEIVMCAPA